MVVMLPGVVFPVAVVVPHPGEVLAGGGLLGVQAAEEVGVDRAAPLAAARRADAETLGEQVLLGVDDVHQIAQGLRGVAPLADVDVDAAGAVGDRARFPQGPDDGLHRLDVFPAADGADDLGSLIAGARDGAVGDDAPAPAVLADDAPLVVTAAGVPDCAAAGDGGRDDAGRLLAGDVVELDFDAESLVFHGANLLQKNVRAFRDAVRVSAGSPPSHRQAESGCETRCG